MGVNDYLRAEKQEDRDTIASLLPFVIFSQIRIIVNFTVNYYFSSNKMFNKRAL
jgi:hypothetical protein